MGSQVTDAGRRMIDAGAGDRDAGRLFTRAFVAHHGVGPTAFRTAAEPRDLRPSRGTYLPGTEVA